MKIANITLHNIDNYGSVLQALATEHILGLFGHDVETINFVRETAEMPSVAKVIREREMSLIQKLKLILLMPSVRRSKDVFEKFRKSRLKLSSISYKGDREIENNPPVADIYCSGSDQVWNPIWQNGVPGPYLLNFAPDDKKKISFASSLGIDKIPIEYAAKYKQLLSRYSAISVREETAVTALKDIGIESTLVLDPTIIAGREFWDSIASPRLIKEDYVFIYQLGHERFLGEYAEEFARRKNLKLYRMCNDYFKVPLGGRPVLFPSPEDVLSLIKHSSYVITNSFHATAFSLIFEKRFLEAYPKKFSSRISSVLNLTGLSDKVLIKDLTNYDYGKDSIYNYKEINKILSNHRALSLDFLNNALEKFKSDD